MPKARLDGRRQTRCTNLRGYEKKKDKGALFDAQAELAEREIALCKEVARWIKDDPDKIVDLLLSPQGTARGYLSKWVAWADKHGMPTLPAEYANEEERDQKLRANFRALVDRVCKPKAQITGLLLTLKGTMLRKNGSGADVPLVEPNGEVDRVMRIWDVLDEAYEDVMDTKDYDYEVLAKIGLAYAHPNEL